MSCRTCEKIRAHLPEAIRRRLAVVEARMKARQARDAPRVTIKYTPNDDLPARADSPRHFPARSQGGDGAAES